MDDVKSFSTAELQTGVCECASNVVPVSRSVARPANTRPPLIIANKLNARSIKWIVRPRCPRTAGRSKQRAGEPGRTNCVGLFSVRETNAGSPSTVAPVTEHGGRERVDRRFSVKQSISALPSHSSIRGGSNERSVADGCFHSPIVTFSKASPCFLL